MSLEQQAQAENRIASAVRAALEAQVSPDTIRDVVEQTIADATEEEP